MTMLKYFTPNFLLMLIWKPTLIFWVQELLSCSIEIQEEYSKQAKKGRPRKLPPLKEFFLTIVRLRLGLLEQDIAYRFGISQSTVSRIFTTWINFMYLQFKRIPLWPPQGYIRSHMPQVFRERYPTTWVIIDATEVFIQQPALPELQQLTFSTYKNHNTLLHL